MLELNSKLREVIVASQLRADAPVSELRKITGMRDHSIRYWMSQAIDQGLISRRSFINLFRLGYTQHQIYISLSVRDEKIRQGVVNRFIESERVPWLSRLGGDYQYGSLICSRNLVEVFEFFNSISEEFGPIFLEKAIAVRVALTFFGASYLAPHIQREEPLVYRVTTDTVDLDEIDQRLLSSITRDASQSTYQVARGLGLPQSTVDYRLRKLEEQEVIVGHYYHFRPEKMGMHSFLMLICSKGISSSLRQQLYEFCCSEPHITVLVEAIGNWDFEFVVEVPHAEEGMRIMERVQDQFGDRVHWVRLLPLFAYLKVREYPFDL